MNNKWGYQIVRLLLKPIFILYYRPTFINKKVIPKQGPIILVGNHVHLFDQCLPLVCTRRSVCYLAKKEYFDSKFAWFFKLVGCIPVNRQIKDDFARQAALEVLKKGGALGIFPEGTRNRTKSLLLPFKLGAVSLAQKSGATLVPFGITGQYKRGKNNQLTIRFGTPFQVKATEDLLKANEKLRNEVKALLTVKD